MTTKQSEDPLVGQILFDNYAILDRLGEGKMGRVYRAKHRVLDKVVAIKTLKVADKELTSRFEREVRTHSLLKHVNIVEAIDCLISPAGEAFFVMEYLDGINLEELIKDKKRVQKEDELASIILQVSSALEHAHQKKIIHRDLKPGNIVIQEKDNQLVVKVVDFGLAKVEDDAQKLTVAGQTLGSPLYMSPEQCMGLQLTSRSDIYSFAIVIYELVTGEPPFLANSVHELMAAHCDPSIVPPPMSKFSPNLRGLPLLEKALRKALETNPDSRQQTIGEFKKDIVAWWRSISSNPLPEELSFSSGNGQNDTYFAEEQKWSLCDLVAIQREQKYKQIRLAEAAVGVEKKGSARVALLKLSLLTLFGVILSVVLAAAIIANLESLEKAWLEASRAVSQYTVTKKATTPEASTAAPPRKESKPEVSGQTQTQTQTPNPTPTGTPKAKPRQDYFDQTDANEGRRL